MTDTQLIIKGFIAAMIITAVVALGYLVVFVIIPLIVLVIVIDVLVRMAYNRNLEAVRKGPALVDGPDLMDFDARLHEGMVAIGWHASLPRGATMDVYRLRGNAGGTTDEIIMRGDCVLSTSLAETTRREELFFDTGLDPGTYYYVPILTGQEIEQEPLNYHLFDFTTKVQFAQRRRERRLRGEAIAVTVEPPETHGLEDLRDDAHRMADDIMSAFRDRKKRDAELDAAIARIRDSDDLSEEEKQEAVALLETRAETI